MSADSDAVWVLELHEGDVFYPSAMWPTWARHMLFKRHKNYHERYTLWLFFVGNGLDPEIARDWIMRWGGYDASAWSHITNMMVRRHTVHGYYWDMHLRSNQPF